MNPLAAEKLRELLARDGRDILREPDRVRGWLNYSCPGLKREINVLMLEMEHGIPRDLLDAERKTVLVARLVDDVAIAGSWAVDAWAASIQQGAEQIAA